MPVPTPVVVPGPTLGKLRQSADRRSVSATVACPAGRATPCRGTVTVRTASSVSVGGGRYQLTLGSARLTARPGGTTTVAIRLSASARSLLARRRTLKARVVLEPTDTAARSSAITLKAPAKRRAARRGGVR